MGIKGEGTLGSVCVCARLMVLLLCRGSDCSSFLKRQECIAYCSDGFGAVKDSTRKRKRSGGWSRRWSRKESVL